jgi:tetratricopeptide (TPR) repeat protein
MLMILILQVGVVSKTWLNYQSMVERQVHIEETISYWKTVVNKYPDYRDGYFRLSVLSFQVGRDEEAKLYLQKVFALDPNFIEWDELASRLGSRK